MGCCEGERLTTYPFLEDYVDEAVVWEGDGELDKVRSHIWTFARIEERERLVEGYPSFVICLCATGILEVRKTRRRLFGFDRRGCTRERGLSVRL